MTTATDALALGGEVTETSYKPGPLTLEEWEETGRTLGRIAKASNWWVGDWLVAGEELFPDRYSQAMDATGLEFGTLANCASVSRRVPPENRRSDLSWSLHSVVAKLAPADQPKWLDRAAGEGLNVRALRAAIDAPKAPQPQWSNGNGHKASEGEQRAAVARQASSGERAPVRGDERGDAPTASRPSEDSSAEHIARELYEAEREAKRAMGIRWAPDVPWEEHYGTDRSVLVQAVGALLERGVILQGPTGQPE